MVPVRILMILIRMFLSKFLGFGRRPILPIRPVLILMLVHWPIIMGCRLMSKILALMSCRFVVIILFTMSGFARVIFIIPLLFISMTMTNIGVRTIMYFVGVLSGRTTSIVSCRSRSVALALSCRSVHLLLSLVMAMCLV